MAYFPPHFIDELLARVSLKDLIGQHTKLQQRGNDLVGLCPFHKEKTPSFHVSEQKGVYHCFGCDASGNAITFMTAHRGLSPKEAIQSLAEQYHVPLPKIQPPEKEAAQNNYYQRLYATLESATTYFSETLFADHASARKARLYLTEERNLDEETIRHFQIGFAPEGWQDMIHALTTKGHTLDDMITLGLAKKHEQKIYSFFRSRIMIPIKDRRDRTIAFGGRILQDDTKQSAKYINSTNHPLFDKSSVLFQAPDIRNMTKNRHPLVLVEGYMDVISLYQGGVSHAVAALGTSVTTEHLKLLWQKSSRMIVCLDGDIAGKKAIVRLVENALPLLSPEKKLQIALLPKDIDPDGLVRSNQMAQLQEILNNPLPLSEWLWHYLHTEYPLDRPENLAALEQHAMSLLQTMHHDTLRRHFVQFMRDKLWERRTQKNKKTVNFGGGINADIVHSSSKLRERRYHIVLYILIKRPELLHEFSDLLTNIKPSLPALVALQECLLAYMWTAETLENKSLVAYLQGHHMEQSIDVLDSFHMDRIVQNPLTLVHARHILEDIRRQYTLWLTREEKRRDARASSTT